MLQYNSNNRKSNDYWDNQKNINEINKITNLKVSGAIITQKKDDVVRKVYYLKNKEYKY